MWPKPVSVPLPTLSCCLGCTAQQANRLQVRQFRFSILSRKSFRIIVLIVQRGLPVLPGGYCISLKLVSCWQINHCSFNEHIPKTIMVGPLTGTRFFCQDSHAFLIINWVLIKGEKKAFNTLVGVSPHHLCLSLTTCLGHDSHFPHTPERHWQDNYHLLRNTLPLHHVTLDA